jgi:hypothetical protein
MSIYSETHIEISKYRYQKVKRTPVACHGPLVQNGIAQRENHYEKMRNVTFMVGNWKSCITYDKLKINIYFEYMFLFTLYVLNVFSMCF